MKFVYISKCFLLTRLHFQIRRGKVFDDFQVCDFPLNGRQFPNGLYIFKSGAMSRLYFAIIDGVYYKVLGFDLLWFIHNGYNHATSSLLDVKDSYLSEKGLQMKRFAAQIYDNTGMDKLSDKMDFKQRISIYKRHKAMRALINSRHKTTNKPNNE